MNSNLRMITVAGILIFLSILILLELWLGGAEVGIALKDGALTNAQSKAVDYLKDMQSLLISWVIGLMGATAFFVKQKLEQKMDLSRIDFSLIGFIFIFSIWSLYFGHLGLDATIRSLSVTQFPINSSNVHFCLKAQYITGMFALSGFAFFVLQYIYRQKKIK